MINSEEPCSKSDTFQWRLQCSHLRQRKKMSFNPCVIMSANRLNPKPSFLATWGGKKSTSQRQLPMAGYYDSWKSNRQQSSPALWPSNFRWSNCCHFPIRCKARRSLALRIPTSWDLKRGSWVSFAPLSQGKWKCRKASDEWEAAWNDCIFNWIKIWADPNRTLCARPLSFSWVELVGGQLWRCDVI